MSKLSSSQPVKSPRVSYRLPLLAGISIMALVAATASADAGNLRRSSAQNAAAQAAAQANASSQAAARAAMAARGALKRANYALASMRAAQIAARNIAVSAASSVPNGLQTGGLVVAEGAVPGPTDGGGGLWQGADLPTQEVVDGHYAVTVDQNEKKAILTWESFNVGKDTTLAFQQDDSSWIALNRVMDPGVAPSRIEGAIKADGQVYVINRNGIIFSGSSQVNVGTLVASSLALSNEQFMAGINTKLLERGRMTGSLTGHIKPTFGDYGESFSFSPDAQPLIPGEAPGPVTVEAGARIETASGGKAMLFAPHVTNAGSISAADGQVILAAGENVYLKESDDLNGSLDVRGFDVAVSAPSEWLLNNFQLNQALDRTWRPGIDTFAPYVADVMLPGMRERAATVGYSAVNKGAIVSQRGDITMQGREVVQDGVLYATTALNNRSGSIRLQAWEQGMWVTFIDDAPNFQRWATGSLFVQDGSVTLVEPDPTDVSSIEGSAVNARYEPGRVELRGVNIHVRSGADIIVPSGDISVVASLDASAPPDVQGRIGGVRDGSLLLIEDGATLSTAGLTGVPLDMASNIVEAELRIAELADSILFRDSWLRGETVYVDRRNSGAFEDGPLQDVEWGGEPGEWFGTPLANVSAWLGVGNTTLGELSTLGGTITLKSGGSLIVREGATLDVSGGAVAYSAGWVTTTKLLGADGRVYDIGQASPDIEYIGFAGDRVVFRERWGRIEHYRSLRAQPSRFEPGYIEGRDAGTIRIYAAEAMVLEGSLKGGVITGWRQGQGDESAQAGSLIIGNATNENRSWIPHDIVISAAPPRLADDMSNLDAFYVPPTVDEDFAFPLVKTAYLDQDMLNESGLGSFEFNFFRNFEVEAGAEFRTVAGAEVKINANTALDVANEGNVVIDGRILSPGGKVEIRGGLNTVSLGGDSAIDVRGQWFNGLIADGPVAIDGGSIAIDALNIAADEGALLDVSGGGWLRSDGQGFDIDVGDAGDIFLDGIGADALNNLDLKAYAAGSGGSLDITTEQSAQLGGSAPADPSVMHIDESLYAQRRFRALSLDASEIVVPDGVDIVHTPTSVDLRDVDLLAAVSGTPIEQIGRLAVLPLHERERLDDTSLNLEGRRIEVGLGTSLRTDVGGWVRLYGDEVLVQGTIEADAGRIDVLGGSQGGFSGQVTVTDDARLLARGLAVTYTDSQGYRRGTVLDGGAVSVRGGEFTIGENSLIDVSGASGEIAIGAGRGVRQIRFDSDGGTIAFQGGGVIRGDLRAFAGGPAALGGTLVVGGGGGGGPSPVQDVISLLGKLVEFAQSNGLGDQNGDGVVDWQDGIGVDFADFGFFGGSLIFSQEYLDAFSSAFLVTDTMPVGGGGGGGAVDPLDYGFSSTALWFLTFFFFPDYDLAAIGQAAGEQPGPPTLLTSAVEGNGFASLALDSNGGQVLFENVHLDLARQIAINGVIGSADGSDSTLRAPHILLRGASAGSAAGSLGGSLRLTSSVLDIDGAVGIRGYADTRLEAVDIRLDAPVGQSARLSVDGDLTLAAAQVYPTTQTTATISASQAIAVQQNGVAAAPLSAGGTLILEAPEIEQGGTLRAPFGAIVLKADQRLTLADGSLTSVSGAGLVAPYGTVRNGEDWVIERALGEDDNPLIAPPEKRIELDAPDVDIAEGSLIDVRGGGDLHAAEFVSGPGGSRDILATDGMYAILPSHAAAASVSGERIWLAGGNGLAAGWYTLLPARYALLPGAYAVQMVKGSEGTVRLSTGTLLDGTMLMQGRLGDAYGGGSDRLSTTWRVMSGDVVRRYTEYNEAYANSFFASDAFKLAQSRMTGVVPVTPRLPLDSGSLVLQATQSLVLDGQVRSDAASGGRGGLIDIAAGKIAVVGADADRSGLDGFLVIDSDSLSNFGAASLLLGGTRTGDPEGLRLDVTASDLVVRNGNDSALSAPEIILTASETITVADGSVVEARGGIAGGAGDLIMTPQVPESIDDKGTGWDGDDEVVPSRDWGSVIRLSNGDPVIVRRENVDTTTGGLIDIGAGAVLRGGEALLIDATQDVFTTGARLEGDALSLGAGSIGFGGGSGLVLDSAALAALATSDSLTLRSYTTIDFHESVDLSGLTAVTFDAAALVGYGAADISVSGNVLALENNAGSFTEPTGTGSGDLAMTAERLVLGQGDKALRGFGAVRLTGNDGIVGRGGGSLDAGAAAVTLTTPVLTGRGAANQSVTTSGSLALTSTGGTSSLSAADSLGTILSLSGADVTLASSIVARGGAVNVTATAGSLTLASGSLIDVEGFGKSFYDVTEYVDAGSISLGAIGGDLRQDVGARLALAGLADGGSAGRLSLVSAGGDVVMNGIIEASAAAGETAGSFSLDTDSLADFAGLNAILNDAGFFAAREFRVRGGDVVVDGTTRSERFSLTTDSGRVTVTGTIDATATYGGRISIAGGDGVVMESSAVLMAGATDGVDGLGSGRIVLDAGEGQLDVRGGVLDVAGGEGGKVRFRARRTAGNDGVEVANLSASILGARSSVLEGVAVYDASADGTVESVWDQAVADAGGFEAAAPGIAAGLGGGIDVAAGIEIRSDGDLSLSTDIDLLDTFATAREGGLTLRAAGDLSLQGNLSDGFSAADDSGVLQDTASWDLRLVAGADLSSANLLAVTPLAALGATGGSVIVGAADAGKAVRTGTGDIHVAAGRDVVLAGYESVICTAGRADPTVFADFDTPAGATYGIDGGNLAIAAQGDVTAQIPSDKGQIFAEWLYRQGAIDQNTGEMLTSSSWWVDHANFDTGIGALGGGNVSVSAGGDLVDLGVYQPTNARLRGPRDAGAVRTLEVRNGGRMSVTAGGAIRGGQVYIGRGAAVVEAGELTTGRMVTTTRNRGRNVMQYRFAPVLGLSDAVMTVKTAGDLRVHTVTDALLARADRWQPDLPDTPFSGHTDRTAIDLKSSGGDIILDNDTYFARDSDFDTSGRLSGAQLDGGTGIFPAKTRITALNGTVRNDGFLQTLPSTTGELRILAAEDIQLGRITMGRALPDFIPSPFNPHLSNDTFLRERMRNLLRNDYSARVTPFGGNPDVLPMAENDFEPSRVYALGGSIVLGALADDRGFMVPSIIVANEQTWFKAGSDIRGNNSLLELRNLRAADTTLMQAGRDVIQTDGRLFIEGPGGLVLAAGRDVVGTQGIWGEVRIFTVGNRPADWSEDPNPSAIVNGLPDEGAEIAILAGLNGRAPDYDAFVAAYLDPANVGAMPDHLTATVGGVVVPLYLTDAVDTSIDGIERLGRRGLVSFMAEIGGETLAPLEAWAAFQALPELAQQRFIRRVYMQELREAGRDQNRGLLTGGYNRGFAAIDVLFPGDDWRGDVLMRDAAFRTLRGGDIQVLTPGGGFRVAALNQVPDSEGGVVTLDDGHINIFADGDLVVNSSRVLTFGGGDVIVWASEGDIDAGRGAKTVRAALPPEVLTDADGVTTLQERAIVSGSGIGTVIGFSGALPGDVDLIAPEGVVDAGDAGIRVSGNFSVAALVVLNAENIQVAGEVEGVPPSEDTSLVLTVEGGDEGQQAAQEAAEEAANQAAGRATDIPSIITVEVIGYGGGDGRGDNEDN